MLLKGKYLFSSADEFKDLDLTNFQSVLQAFERRIQLWFFGPLEKLLVQEENLFVASAIECMLIDALSGFAQGVRADTHKENFILFLQEKLNIEKRVADEFYNRFRCGILHQTNIKKKSSITDEIEIIHLQEEDNSLFFNPRGFYQLLQKYFKDYMKKVVSDKDLQINFRIRFYHLFRDEFAETKWGDWFNEVVDYEKDIRDSISEILGSYKDETSSDPNYGLSSELWLFTCVTEDTHHKMVNEVKDLLSDYEPRIDVLNVTVEQRDIWEKWYHFIDITYSVKTTKNRFYVTKRIETD